MNKILQFLTPARIAFKDYQSQCAYEWAWNNHEFLNHTTGGDGEAYREGLYGNKDLNKKKVTYPYALAGRDRQKMGV